jgi:WD40 repeat protein
VLRRWRWQDGKYQEATPPVGHSDNVNAILFDRDGHGLVSTSEIETFYWRATDGQFMSAEQTANLTPTALSDDQAMHAVGFIPEQRSILNIKALPSGNRALFGRLFDEKQNESRFKIDFGEDYREAAWCAAVHPTKSLLATGHWNSKIRLWGISENLEPKMLFEWQAHNGHVCAVTFSPNGNSIASAGWDHQTKIWNIDYQSLEATPGMQLENQVWHTRPAASYLHLAGRMGLCCYGT